MGAVKEYIEEQTYSIMKLFGIVDDNDGDIYSKIFVWLMEHGDFKGNLLDQFYHANICPQCLSLKWGDACCAKLERII
jgi:hypothetical protein